MIRRVGLTSGLAVLAVTSCVGVDGAGDPTGMSPDFEREPDCEIVNVVDSPGWIE
jgi:hypothetical protein